MNLGPTWGREWHDVSSFSYKYTSHTGLGPPQQPHLTQDPSRKLGAQRPNPWRKGGEMKYGQGMVRKLPCFSPCLDGESILENLWMRACLCMGSRFKFTLAIPEESDRQRVSRLLYSWPDSAPVASLQEDAACTPGPRGSPQIKPRRKQAHNPVTQRESADKQEVRLPRTSGNEIIG